MQKIKLAATRLYAFNLLVLVRFMHLFPGLTNRRSGHASDIFPLDSLFACAMKPIETAEAGLLESRTPKRMGTQVIGFAAFSALSKSQSTPELHTVFSFR
jgi:hypothetical protein